MNSIQTGKIPGTLPLATAACPLCRNIKEIMDRHGITRIVDVRSKPWTRRFSLKELTAAFGDS